MYDFIDDRKKFVLQGNQITLYKIHRRIGNVISMVYLIFKNA